MSTSLKDRITEDMKNAMRAKDAERLGAIRLLLAAIKQKEVDERITLDDAAVLGIVEKLIKQRSDSIEQFEKAGRADLAAKEKDERELLKGYLPQQMSDAELSAAVDAAVAESGATGPQAMGKTMALLKPRIAGRADMGKASALVKQRLKCRDRSRAVDKFSRGLADQLTEPLPHLDVLIVEGFRIQQIHEVVGLGQLFSQPFDKLPCKSRIEMRAGAGLDDVQSDLGRLARPPWSLMRQGIEGVAQCNNAGLERNVFACEAFRPATIPALMMTTNDRDARLQQF